MILYYILCVTDRDRLDDMSRLYSRCGLKCAMSTMAFGTAGISQLRSLGLESVDKAMITGIGDEAQRTALFKSAKQELYIDVPGHGVMLSVPLKSVAGGSTLSLLTDKTTEKGGRPSMNFDHELIIAVLNEGHSDEVMNAARQAGAGGGTVIHAKGTASRMPDKFFGLSISEEKDMVYIIAPSAKKTEIMQAIARDAGAGTKAGAICFSLPVSDVVGLRESE